MATEKKYYLKDDFGNVCFDGKDFEYEQDAFDFLLETFPVIYNDDGTDDRDDEIGSYWIVNKDSITATPVNLLASRKRYEDIALICAIIINEDILGGTVFQTFDLAYTFAKEFQQKYGYDFDWENHDIDFDEAIIKFVNKKLKSGNS